MSVERSVLVLLVAVLYFGVVVLLVRIVVAGLDRNNPHVKTPARLRQQPNEGEKNNI